MNQSKALTPTKKAKLFAEIQNIDSYMAECERIGQGINTKEIFALREAMLPIIGEAVGNVFDIQAQITSRAAKNEMHYAFDCSYPGFREMFRPKEGV